MRSSIAILLFLALGCKEPIVHPPGGYPYPSEIAGIDTTFYFYPVKDVEPKEIVFGDSYQYLLYRMFNEPNISLKPLPSETLRLTYVDAFDTRAIIVLTEGSITVKKGSTEGISYIDESCLTKLERLHLTILDRYYPIEKIDKNHKLKAYLDSMTRLYPELYDVKYYHHIYEKQFVLTGKKVPITEYKIHLTYKQYHSIYQQISSSGFWSMPSFIKCNETIADGYLLTLEANTKYQYQKVSLQSCPGNRTKFTIACDNLIRIAKLEQEISIVWDEF